MDFSKEIEMPLGKKSREVHWKSVRRGRSQIFTNSNGIFFFFFFRKNNIFFWISFKSWKLCIESNRNDTNRNEPSQTELAHPSDLLLFHFSNILDAYNMHFIMGDPISFHSSMISSKKKKKKFKARQMKRTKINNILMSNSLTFSSICRIPWWAW